MGKDQSKLQRERLGQQSDWKGEEGSGREAKGGIMKTVNAVTTRNIFYFYDAIPDIAISSHVCEWSNSFSQETERGGCCRSIRAHWREGNVFNSSEVVWEEAAYPGRLVKLQEVIQGTAISPAQSPLAWRQRLLSAHNAVIRKSL